MAARSNLAMRVLTAAVAVPPLLLLMFQGPAWGFYALVVAVIALGSIELFRMTHPDDRVSQGLLSLLTLVASALFYFGTPDPRLLALALLVPLLGLFVPLVRLGDIQTAGIRIMAGAAGPLYLGVALTTIALIRRDVSHGARWVVLSLCFAWLADTGGYFFGRFLGKTKLYEAISPKKTRAGFVGALVGAGLSAVVASLWYLPELDLAHGVIVGVLAGGVGQFGDLVESLLKRSTGVKDSGTIVPGHGGILDRIDALLIVSPLVYVYLLWSGHAR